ncbi:hypothetical protein TTHERM_000755869 (macronuclear) [Tetrahymena thermophila SB210]|uniref:Uncharacterized protein n=1 Tax=Tetrahymena thermophila (strain SB210) TaxID=312017 RepID=W7X239_TETTS|nr:hypothetical protein TTHERM_000755869 [Tetrahymena thermophila SB210]EWS71707.1 hypothetical protein TTHERM_000755869 [Tetrahymena thermophila SB210]|eukprot:XP_012655748.1 hypothetical protein TTHERM_000755869 [Tetrahymena thermophila SB210]
MDMKIEYFKQQLLDKNQQLILFCYFQNQRLITKIKKLLKYIEKFNLQFLLIYFTKRNQQIIILQKEDVENIDQMIFNVFMSNQSKYFNYFSYCLHLNEGWHIKMKISYFQYVIKIKLHTVIQQKHQKRQINNKQIEINLIVFLTLHNFLYQIFLINEILTTEKIFYKQLINIYSLQTIQNLKLFELACIQSLKFEKKFQMLPLITLIQIILQDL